MQMSFFSINCFEMCFVLVKKKIIAFLRNFDGGNETDVIGTGNNINRALFQIVSLIQLLRSIGASFQRQEKCGQLFGHECPPFIE